MIRPRSCDFSLLVDMQKTGMSASSSTVYSVKVEPRFSRYQLASPIGSAVITVTWSIIRGAIPRGT